MQGSLPIQGALPMQGSLPIQGSLPMQGSLPIQGSLPMQGSLPIQGSLAMQGSLLCKGLSYARVFVNEEDNIEKYRNPNIEPGHLSSKHFNFGKKSNVERSRDKMSIKVSNISPILRAFLGTLSWRKENNRIAQEHKIVLFSFFSFFLWIFFSGENNKMQWLGRELSQSHGKPEIYNKRKLTTTTKRKKKLE